VWKKCIDAEDFHVSICAADTIFTYFQDKLGMTHYLLFVGDNNVGKSNNLRVFQYLAYRPLFDISITPANIYRFLGSVEEGQGIILEDEIDNIEEEHEKMKLYKAGYIAGTKVSRSEDIPQQGRKSQGYWTYCFKAFTSEKQPDNHKAKGFNERTFVIKCSVGNPEYDISEVINPAGDEHYHSFLEELDDIRKTLLIYRLLHHDDPIPDIELNITNRDKQLCKPLIRLFQNTDAVNEILDSLSKLLVEKKGRKANTLEARIYSIVKDLTSERPNQMSLDGDTVIIENGEIWSTIKAEIEGNDIPGRPQSYETAEYGPISQKKIASILEDRFEGEDARDRKVRKLKFSRRKLNRLGANYSFVDKISVITTTPQQQEQNSTSDTCDTCDTSTGHKPSSETVRYIEAEHKIDGNNVDQTLTNEPLPSLEVSQASQASCSSHTDSSPAPRPQIPYVEKQE